MLYPYEMPRPSAEKLYFCSSFCRRDEGPVVLSNRNRETKFDIDDGQYLRFR